MLKIIIVTVALFISAMFMQACGTQAENSRPVVAAKSLQATTSPAKFNTGSYTTHIMLKDVHPQLAADLPAGGSYLGNWNFNFNEQGRFSANQGNQQVVTAQYSLYSGSVSDSGSQIISFTGQAWHYFCPGTAQNEEGIYSRYFDGSALTLYPLKETCAFRLLLLSAHPLTFSEEFANTDSSYNIGVNDPNFEIANNSNASMNLKMARSQTSIIG